jgi:hypothetical protein
MTLSILLLRDRRGLSKPRRREGRFQPTFEVLMTLSILILTALMHRSRVEERWRVLLLLRV